MIRALLVDDDRELRGLVVDYLERYGMRALAVPDGAGLRRALATDEFDVLLLDLMLPDADGLELCRWVRATTALPIIMLTAQGDPTSRVVGLEMGADDYLPKPFEPRELVARITAVLRRSGGPRPATASNDAAAGATLRFNGWTLDRLSRQLHSPAGVAVALSNAEFRLLAAFIDHPGRVMSRHRLLDLSRAPGVEATDRAIDLAVSRLRQKLGSLTDQRALIRTVRGEGYVFDGELAP